MEVKATKIQIEEFKESFLWKDIVEELLGWLKGFTEEYDAIVDDTAKEHPSTAEVLMHIGDLAGRKKAVVYMLSLPDQLLQLIEDQNARRNTTE
jgi:hypothetical protein